MSVQNDKAADQDNDRRPTEKPEPDEDDRQKAAEMMTAYADDRPTVVLPGSGGSVTGTAVNDWLDDDGNPKYQGDAGSDDQAKKDQVEKDKALNDELRKAAAEENKGEKP